MKGQALYISGVPGLLMQEDMVERMLKGERFAVMDGGVKTLVWIDDQQKKHYEDMGLGNAAKIAAHYRGMIEGILGREVRHMTPAQRKKFMPMASAVLADMVLKGKGVLN